MFLDCHETSSFYFFPERSCGFSQLSDRYLADSILLRSNIAMYLKPRKEPSSNVILFD